MKTFRFILLSIFFVVLFSTISIAQSEIEEAGIEGWGIKMKLDMENLKPPVVQYAIFDSDPIKSYREHLKKLKEIINDDLQDCDDSESAKRIWKKISWNNKFSEVKGSDVNLLYTVPGITQSLARGGRGGKYWFVTKVRRVNKEPICWVISLKAKKSQMLEIVLNKDNVYDLSTIFDEVIFNVK